MKQNYFTGYCWTKWDFPAKAGGSISKGTPLFTMASTVLWRTLSAEKAKTLIAFGEKVASPKINVKTEKWDGGHTYISISFYDYDTNQSIAVIKSSGIGWSISQDQKLAYKAIKKELDKVFPQTR